MNSIVARHYATGEPLRLSWEKGLFTSVTPARVAPANLWVAPPLIDLQINGYGGIDFQQDGLSSNDLLSATRKLRSAGCAFYFLTLVSDEWGRMMARLKHARKLRARSGELLRAIAGWHLEGPFLSGEPGFRGAHDPDAMRNPTPRHIRELRQITETDRVLMTIAPEREGAIAAISLAVSLGIKVNLGHTNASHALLLKAIRAGATGFTHLGNGCPRELDRHDNILWRLFETSGLATGLIPDGIHLSPALFRLMHRLIASEALYYTTDAMSAAGSRPGCYTLGRLKLKVDKSGIVRLPGTANFAGSALKPMDGIIRAAAMLGTRWQEVWPRFSKVPAKMAGLGGVDLKAGNRATFCLLRSASERTPRLIHTFWDGRGGSGRQQFSLWQQTRTPRGARGPTRPKKGRWFDESKPGPLTGRA